jgi:hypothetical protein
MLQEFVELGRGDNSRGVDLLNELEHVIAEFRRLRPPPTFRNSSQLRLVRTSDEESPLRIICGKHIELSSQDFFETPGAAYHLWCYDERSARFDPNGPTTNRRLQGEPFSKRSLRSSDD